MCFKGQFHTWSFATWLLVDIW